MQAENSESHAEYIKIITNIRDLAKKGVSTKCMKLIQDAMDAVNKLWDTEYFKNIEGTYKYDHWCELYKTIRDINLRINFEYHKTHPEFKPFGTPDITKESDNMETKETNLLDNELDLAISGSFNPADSDNGTLNLGADGLPRHPMTDRMKLAMEREKARNVSADISKGPKLPPLSMNPKRETLSKEKAEEILDQIDALNDKVASELSDKERMAEAAKEVPYDRIISKPKLPPQLPTIEPLPTSADFKLMVGTISKAEHTKLREEAEAAKQETIAKESAKKEPKLKANPQDIFAAFREESFEDQKDSFSIKNRHMIAKTLAYFELCYGEKFTTAEAKELVSSILFIANKFVDNSFARPKPPIVVSNCTYCGNRFQKKTPFEKSCETCTGALTILKGSRSNYSRPLVKMSDRIEVFGTTDSEDSDEMESCDDEEDCQPLRPSRLREVKGHLSLREEPMAKIRERLRIRNIAKDLDEDLD